MKADYKAWYVKRDDDGFITEAAIRFYEGEIESIEVVNPETNLKEIRQEYVRKARLKADQLTHLSNSSTFIKEETSDAVLYKSSHFGKIKTDKQLYRFLDKELLKDLKRIAIKGDK